MKVNFDLTVAVIRARSLTVVEQETRMNPANYLREVLPSGRPEISWLVMLKWRLDPQHSYHLMNQRFLIIFNVKREPFNTLIVLIDQFALITPAYKDIR